MGIQVGTHSISLDSRDPGASLHFVSHAHSDHTGGVKKDNLILCSAATKDLVETRISYSIKTADLPENVSLLNSGHMLGSRQLYAETDGGSVVYTGDYQMQRSPVAEKIEVRHADTLIIDSTYPFPNVTFDDNAEVITAIQHYIRSRMDTGSVMFGAYAMGKSQELIRICNEMGVQPLVDNSIARINEVYSRHGVRLDYRTRDLECGITEEDFRSPVWIVSMGKMGKVSGLVASMNMRIFTAVATGFAKTQRFNTDVQFALSDHADFGQALEYIAQCGPKRIYTRGQGRDIFARNLQACGYNAQVLPGNSEMSNLLLNYV